MPSSKYEIISKIVHLVNNLKPKSILDIGIGFGKYGMLFREYLDVWETKKAYNNRSVRIDGVEAFESYRNPVWDVYDNIYIGDVTEIAEIKDTHYDLIFMCDVIEHLDKEKAIKLLHELKYNHILIVTPLRVKKQASVYGNQYENHISVWEQSDMPLWKYEVIDGIQIFRNFAFIDDPKNPNDAITAGEEVK
jgi:hypothetical protein